MSSNELKRQQKIWYAKAKKAGFEDIERNEEELKVNSSTFFIHHKYTRELWESKAEYYRLAEHFLNEYKFESELDRVIWAYHANALSVRNVSATLKKAKIKNVSKSKIHNIVKRLATIMKGRYLVNSKDKDGH